jgi:hypothetical protein
MAEDGRMICTGAKDPGAVISATGPGDLVLFEIASALDYTDEKAIAHHKRRWTIWNIACATALDMLLSEKGVEMLVAPSHAWTKGHDIKLRQAVAKADAKNKDLREAQAMLVYQTMHPSAWMTLEHYLERI